MIQIGIPRMGVYSSLAPVVNRCLEELGIRDVRLEVSPPTTKRTINLGTQHMDENMCLPAKSTLGNILEMADRGDTAVVEWDNCGDCRQKTYGLVHQSVLRQMGIDLPVIPLQPRGILKGLHEVAPHVPTWKWRRVLRELFREIWRRDWEVMEEQAHPDPDAPRIGVCGEIYTMLEPAVNVDLLKRLKEQGAHLHMSLLLSEFLHHLTDDGWDRRRLGWLMVMARLEMWQEIRWWRSGRLRRPDVDYELYHRARQEAERYMPEHTVGGHGKESVIWTIYYALAGFDGVVHIMPFPCMPEATVSVLLDEISRDYGISVNHLVFDQQFGEQNLITRAEAMVSQLRFKKHGLASILEKRRPGVWLGVDIGSTSTKAVLLDGESKEIVDSEYRFTHRRPLEAIKEVLSDLLARNPQMTIKGMATTGSGRFLAKALLSAPLAVDEISAQTIGCRSVCPSVRSIVEIGGQDSKFISLDQSGVPNWFNMNSICSAGTGSFLTSAAREFKVPIEKLGSCARSAECAVTITGRCGVFAEADIVTKQQAGHPQNGIIKGMCLAVAQNFVHNVCRSKKPTPPVVIAGGVALNEGVVDAFAEIVGGPELVIVHPQAKVSGALGAALMALVRGAEGGLDVQAIQAAEFSSTVFQCRDCANQCEITRLWRNDELVAVLGSRCGKYEQEVGKRRETARVA